MSTQIDMDHEVKIISTKRLNHDVIQFRLERPVGYEFTAGQATELTVKEPVVKGPGPFTFTALSSHPYLELTIKIYEKHDGLTAALAKLKAGNTVFITDPWDSFENNGPGIFIAGGAGITPFIALLRQMWADGNIGESWLFFSNKTAEDIFLDAELKAMLGDRYVDVLTRDKNGRGNRHIDHAFLKEHLNNLDQPFYVCGPPGFVESVQDSLEEIGASEQMVNISL